MIVIKRDGTQVEFNTIKIAEAISKAFKASGEAFHDGISTAPYIMADKVAKLVASKDPIEIEKIQDTVEGVLMENGYKKTAKEYILYRQKRTELREKNTKLMTNLREMFEDSESNISNSRRENANIDGNTAMGSMLKFGSETAKAYVDMFVIKPEHAKAHKDGDIHIHDKDFLSIGTTTCSQIDLAHLFEKGFNTGHGSLRTPGSIRTAAQLTCVAIQANQNEQHGGQSIPNFDRFMAPYVIKSYRKILVDILEIVAEDSFDLLSEKIKSYCNTHNTVLSSSGQIEISQIIKDNSNLSDNDVKKVMDRAYKRIDNETYQAMEALIHNLNTLHSRAGAQVPFSSINYGTDTSEEARMVVRNLLYATEAGLGNGETPIFPIQIFRLKHGINFDEGDPNFDLYKLSLRVTAKRLFPNYSFQDATFNKQYYDPENPATEIAYMGCRTRVIGNVNGPEESYSRGNLSFTSINLPRIGIIARGDWDKFFDILDDRLALVADQLIDRFDVQCQKCVKNFPFLMGQGIWLGGDKLSPEDKVKEILKNGTLGIGFIGLAETLVAMMGKHHGESEEAQRMGLEIVRRIRSFCDEKTSETGLNFSCLATPAEGLSGRFVKIDKTKYGVIDGVTDKEYYTNSFHVPVAYKTTFAHKLEVEGPYHELTNGGHISYIELGGDPEKNLAVLDKVVHYMDKCNIGYGAINHPLDRDPVCGFSGIIEGNQCPHCGRIVKGPADIPFDRIRRITGYLVGTLDRFNDAKRAEVHDRVKHG